MQFVDLPLYETDTAEKVDTLIGRLDQVDYVVLSSNRLLKSIPRNPVNYPVTSRYYELLLSEQLGFDRVPEPGSLALLAAGLGLLAVPGAKGWRRGARAA